MILTQFAIWTKEQVLTAIDTARQAMRQIELHNAFGLFSDLAYIQLWGV